MVIANEPDVAVALAPLLEEGRAYQQDAAIERDI